MNIFILDDDMQKNAEYHADKHVVKMILEQTQILCTIVNQYGGETPYRSTHINHPCTKWAGASWHNFIYLRDFTIILCKEYTYRYGKEHKCELITKRLAHPTFGKGKFHLTDFAVIVPDQYKVYNYKKDLDPVLSYRNYYRNEKKHFATWKNRNTPYWFY